MAVKEILEKLQRFGQEKGFFVEMPIKDIDRTCCTSCEVRVIDFDDTKTKVTQQAKLGSIKSCDGLMILPEKERIDFIEMKSAENILVNPKDNKSKSAEMIEIQVDKFDFNAKIRDSLLLLDLIARHKDTKLHGKEQNAYFDIAKHFVILTDITPQKQGLEALVLTMNYLSHYSNPMEKLLVDLIENKLAQLEIKAFHNLQKPVLMSCESFSAYYTNE